MEDTPSGIQDFVEDKLRKIQDFIEDNASQDTGLRRKFKLSHTGQEYCSVVFSLITQTLRITP